MKYKSPIQDSPAEGFVILDKLLRENRITGGVRSKKFDFSAPDVILHVCLYQKVNGKNKLIKKLTTQSEIERELQTHKHFIAPPSDGQFFYEYRFVNPTLPKSIGEKGVNVYCALNHLGGIMPRYEVSN